MSDATGDPAVGETPETGYLLTFDGPANEQRVHTVIPPTAQRWFCRSAQMGDSEPIEWWVMDEEPPEDDTIEITEYRLNPDVPPRTDEESGDMVIAFTCDDTQWLGHGSNGGSPTLGLPEIPPGPEIPRSAFRAEDIAALLVNGEWFDVPTPGRMFELILEPDEGPIKITAGANLIYEDGNGEYVAIAPQMVQGFRFRPSSVAQKPHLTPDGTIRVARDTFAAADPEVQAMVAEASTVLIVEPNGEHVLEKGQQP